MLNLPEYDKMTLRDARELYMYIEKKELLEHYSFPKKPGKDGYYRIYVADPSKKAGRKQLFARTMEELRDKVYEHEKGKNGKVKKTFKQVYEIVLSEKLMYVKSEEQRLSRQNTINKNKTEYKRFFDGTGFESRFIDKISKADIEEIVFYNLQRYDLRDKALNAMKGILRSTFAFAYEQYWIDDNVFDRVNFAKFGGMIVPDVDVEKRVHSDRDLKRILKELHAHQAKKKDYIPAYALEMQILIGARRGEIPPLRKSDIHDGYIAITREQITVKKFDDIPEYFKIVEHTKTNKNRIFPRTVALNEFLERLYAVLEEYYPHSEYLFPADTENGVITNGTVYNYYRRVCKKLEIPITRDVIKGTHSFRRNAITDVVNATGGNLIMASQLFGNSPEVARKNYYTGIDTKEALEALNKRKLS